MSRHRRDVANAVLGEISTGLEARSEARSSPSVLEILLWVSNRKFLATDIFGGTIHDGDSPLAVTFPTHSESRRAVRQQGKQDAHRVPLDHLRSDCLLQAAHKRSWEWQ